MRSVILAVMVVFAVLVGVAAVGSAFDDRSRHPATVLPSPAAAPEAVSKKDVSEGEATEPGSEPVAPSAAKSDDIAEQATVDTETLLSQLPTLLDGDVRRALRKNATRLWHKNGMHGYVVLSGDSAASPAVCKNVVITMIAAQEQRQTAPQKWCHSADEDEWYPA